MTFKLHSGRRGQPKEDIGPKPYGLSDGRPYITEADPPKGIFLPHHRDEFEGWVVTKNLQTLMWHVQPMPGETEVPAELQGAWSDLPVVRRAITAYVAKAAAQDEGGK